MKKLITTIPLFFLFLLAVSQTDTTEYFDPSVLKQPLKTNGHWGINAGGFAGSVNGNSYYGSFLSPNYTYDLSKKFSIQGGIMFNSFNTPGFTTSEGYHILPQSFNSSIIYAQGIYRVNEKVFLTGGAYTSLQPSSHNTLNKAYTNDIKGGKLGIGYNLSEHSSIYFEMQLNKGHSPFNTFGNPYSNQFNYSPFNHW